MLFYFINLYLEYYLCALLFLFAANTTEAIANPANEYPKLALSPVLILAVVSPAFTALLTPSFTVVLGTSVSTGASVLATNPSIALFNAVTAAFTSYSVALTLAIVSFAFSNAKLTAAHDSGL